MYLLTSIKLYYLLFCLADAKAHQNVKKTSSVLKKLHVNLNVVHYSVNTDEEQH